MSRISSITYCEGFYKANKGKVMMLYAKPRLISISEFSMGVELKRFLLSVAKSYHNLILYLKLFDGY